jgi:hypothetical protein
MKYILIHSCLTSGGVAHSPEIIARFQNEDTDLEGCSLDDLITIDGQIHNMLPYKKEGPTNWIYKEEFEFLNDLKVRHVGYVGGVNDGGFISDTRSKEQKEAIDIYIKYMVRRFPDVIILGYDKVSGYDSQGFNVNILLKKLGLKKNNYEYNTKLTEREVV